MFLLIAFLIFSAALVAAAYFTFTIPRQQEQQIMVGRLREVRAQGVGRSRVATDLIQREGRGSLAVLGDFFAWIGILRRLQEFINQANLKYRAAEVFSLAVLIAAGSWFLFGLLGLHLLLLRILLSAGLGMIPILYILWMRSKRLRKFEENLADAIDLFNRSMKAGHNIHNGLETIAAETFDPVRMEFKKVIEELALGSPLEAALHNLGRRVPLVDLKFFITGLILQRQTGANMVQVLENLSTLIRERLNLAAKMKAATAQQRFSAALLCSIPIVLAIGFWFLKPEYIVMLYSDETGSKFLTYAIVSEIIGILVIRKIASPKF